MKALKLRPALKEIIWGGQKLKKIYENEQMGNIAEAWLLSSHRDGQSLVAGGEFDGLPLPDALTALGSKALGNRNKSASELPILIKLIDAREKLSVQVHPDDYYARKHENDNGKTESWYIIDCDEGAHLYYGFSEQVTKSELKIAINEGRLLDFVNKVPVKKGDVVFIPSGTLHAIGGGIFLAEVQQSSNTTYRVFDYERKDKDGNMRELHVEKALDVLNTEVQKADFSPEGEREVYEGHAFTLLTKCEHFTMSLLEVEEEYKSIADKSSFVSLVVIEGEGSLHMDSEEMPLKKGDSVFIPAESGSFSLAGSMNVLETRL